jgi:hypothetical protein
LRLFPKSIKTQCALGWRERDWARFTRKEWDAYTAPGERAVSTTPSGSYWRRPVGGSVALAAIVSLLAFVGWDALKSPASNRGLSSPPPIVNLAPAPASDRSVIRIRWKPSDVAPAPAAGRICVTDAAYGRICASYVIGERPADTLTRRIEALGLRVESAG